MILSPIYGRLSCGRMRELYIKGPWMKPVGRWLKVAMSVLQSLGSPYYQSFTQWAECSLDSLPHHITSHYHPDNFQSRPTMDGFPTFLAFPLHLPDDLRVHLFLGLSLSCSPLGSLSSLLTLCRDPQWPLLLLLVSELRLRFRLVTPHLCRQLEGSPFWGSVRSLSQKATSMPYEEDLSSSQG